MEAKDLAQIADTPENSRIRAELWGDFVGWGNRWKQDEKFLKPILQKHNAQRILDVALGDGVDTVYLLKQGFDVN